MLSSIKHAMYIYALLPGDPETTTDNLGLAKEVVHVEVLGVQEAGRSAAVQEASRSSVVLREIGRKAASGKYLRKQVATVPDITVQSQCSGIGVLHIVATLGDGDRGPLS